MGLQSPFPEGPASTEGEKDYGQTLRSLLLKRASEGQPTGEPEIPIWDLELKSQNFPINTETPNERNINDMMKLPADWDYQTAVLGPNNEQLPEGALQWTPHATPYYGPGLEGWWRGTISRLNAPISYESDTIIPQAEPGEELPWYQKALGSLENLGAKFYNAGGEEGGAPSPLTYVTRGVSEVVKTVLDLAQVPSLGTERALGVGRAVEERAAEEYGLPEPEYKPFWEGWNPFQEFNSFMSPGGWATKLGHMLGAGKLNTDETYDLLKEGWNTGRIFYTTVADPLVAKEYKDRYNDGEDPVLLGMELENPMAELAGQIVLDPLNLLGLGARKLKDARKLTSVADDFFRLPKVLDDFLRSAGDVDELGAVEKIQELAGAVRTAFTDLKNDYRISALTADGKRYIVSRKTNDLAEWTIRTNSGGDPERAMDIIRGSIMLNSDDADEIATGVSLIKGAAIEPSPYFSNAGLEMSATLRNLIGVDDAGKLDPARFLDELAKAADEGIKVGDETLKGLDGVVHHINRKMDDTIEKMFPTVTERIKAGEKLPFALKQLARFDRFAQAAAYKPINTFFAAIYMGLSPGYAMRNLFTNTLHVLVDKGPGALRYKPTTLAKITGKWLGDQLPRMEGFGKGVLGVETYEAISRRLPFSKASETFERWGATQVVARSVQDTMQKMLKPGRALPDVAPLVAAGMDPESANLLMKLVVNNYGDVKKATTQFKEMVAKGNIDAFRTMGWVSEGNTKALSAFGLSDEFAEAITGATSRDDAISRVNAIFDDVFADSARVADEVPVASEFAEAVDVIDDLADAKASGVDIANSLIENATSSIEANSQAMNSMDRTLKDLWLSASSRSIDDPEKLRELTMFRNGYADLFDGVLLSREKRVHDGHRATAVGWKRTFKQASSDTPLATLRQWWDEIGIPGEAPKDLTLSRLWSAMWEDWYFPKVRQHWQETRDMLYGMSEQVVSELEQLVPFDNAMRASLGEPRGAQVVAQLWDDFLDSDDVLIAVERAIKRGNNAEVARIYANQFGIPSVSETGAPLDKMILGFINDNIPEGRFATLSDVPPEVSQKALLKHLAKEDIARVAGEATPEELVRLDLEMAKDLGGLPEVTKPVQPYAGNTPTMARVVEQQTDGLRNMQDELLRGIDDNWGRNVPQDWSRELERTFNAWEKGATKGVAKARLISIEVANAARDFTMLSYPQKKYFDLALAYIYPYHFWYNRTYSNWMKRIATSPEVIAGYAKYRDAMAKIHAGAPEWWKYNINSNELLGIDMENPLFFNLESTLNPMQGITGIDFTDRKKRVNWFTAMLDELNKFGPSTWTPFSIATAAVLAYQGEEEAASRWAGRLIPQTKALKNLTALLNIGPPGGVELDPAVSFYSGGIDPYERRQVGRALYGLQEQGLVGGTDAMDAAMFQEGPAWDMAMDARSRSRSAGQLFSFIFGTGFKARSAADMEIDQFDAQYFNLWALEDSMDPEEFQQAMDELRQDFPFMDAVLLSRKGGLARDRGYAYNVLGRLPPGQKDDIAEAAGFDDAFIDKFYADKGHIEDWEETDRQRFMAFIVDVGAILDMPDDATKDEWKQASARYSEVDDWMKDRFGEDIQEGIDRFWTIRREDGDEAGYAYLDASPIVQQAMTWKDATYINDPLMGKYYTSIQLIERYYNGVMWDAIENEYGKEIWDIEDGYFAAKLLGTKQAKQHLTDNPQLKEMWDDKARYREITAEMMVGVEKMLRADVHPFLRAGAEARSVTQQNIMEVLGSPEQSPYQLGWQDFSAEMTPHLQRLVEDNVLLDEDLAPAAYDQLEYIAGDFGLTTEMMMELIQRSMYGGQPTPQPQTLQPLLMPPSEGGRQELNEYRIGELVYGFKRDPVLTEHAKKFLASTVKTIGTSIKEKDGVARYGYFQPERDPREHTSYTLASVDPTNINLMRHEGAHAIDRQFDVSSTQAFQRLFFPMDTHPNVVADAIDDPYGRVEAAFAALESGQYMPVTHKREFFSFLFAQLAANPEEVPPEIKEIYKPYIIFP